MKVGFIGLGHMGAGMAGNLLKAGHEVTVYNRTRAKGEALMRRGATEAATIADACRGDVVFTMLANDDVVEAAVFGEHGILASLPAGAIHISSSTITVGFAERLAPAHAGAGQGFLPAPVFRLPRLAPAGDLYLLAPREQT